MRALVVSRPDVWSVEDVPVPEIGPTEVLVAVKAAGICGSDLHLLAGKFPPTPFPIIPGHEFAGVVAAVGDKVADLKPGDRVAVDPSLFCTECRHCKAGRGNLCLNWGAIGDTVNGAFAEYVAVPAANAYLMPDELSFAAGALVEPLSCVVHGLHRLSIRTGSDLLVVGGGTMGLSFLQAARASGASQVDVVDVDDSRRRRALAFGAARVAPSVHDLLNERGRGYDYVVEATGVAAAAEAGIEAVDRGGTFLVCGVAPEEARLSISPYRIYSEELTILGTMAVLYSFKPALDVIGSGAIDVEGLVTHQFALEEFGAALAAVRDRNGMKVQIRFD